MHVEPWTQLTHTYTHTHTKCYINYIQVYPRVLQFSKTSGNLEIIPCALSGTVTPTFLCFSKNESLLNPSVSHCAASRRDDTRGDRSLHKQPRRGAPRHEEAWEVVVAASAADSVVLAVAQHGHSLPAAECCAHGVPSSLSCESPSSMQTRTLVVAADFLMAITEPGREVWADRQTWLGKQSP